MKPLTFRDVMPPTIIVPPVTGVNRNNNPYANLFDRSGAFRDRAGSGTKRLRTDGQEELLNSVYNLTRDFPPLELPGKPAVDVATIKSILVEAANMVGSLEPVLGREDASVDSKAVLNMLKLLVGLVGAVVEKGIEPLSAVVVGAGAPTGRRFASAARGLANPVAAAPPPPPPGRRELVEALARSEREAVVFGTNLGAVGMAHRGSLNSNFTADLQRKVVEKAEGKPDIDVNESLRIVEDALSCAESVDFMGQRSSPYLNQREGATGSFCSMPVKLTFQDRDTRINFERTVRENAGLRVIQSLPRSVRTEMALFRKAMECRYPDKIVMARTNARSLSFTALIKNDGDKKWVECREAVPIPLGVMLPGFVESVRVDLPDLVTDFGGGEEGDGMAVGGGEEEGGS
jgi:hypothetical protein